MAEIIASIIATEVASHPEEVLDITGEVFEGAADCVCSVLDGIGSIFD